MKSIFRMAQVSWLVCASLITLVGSTLAPVAQVSFDPGSIPGGLPTGLPPFLISSVPSNQQQNVSLDSPVQFNFLGAMAPVQSIAWSANLVPANFSYSWSADGKTLTCTYQGGFPANSAITWTLDPTVFKDSSGTPLLEVNNSGQFKTGSGTSTNNPCDGGPGSTNSGTGSLSLFKTVYYVQTSASTPLIDPDSGPAFVASVASPKTNAVTAATVQLPNGTSKPLQNLFGTFFLLDEFTSQEELDAAYPAGLYKVTLTRTTGSAVFNLNVGSAPPTPQIANFAQTQAFNPAADFTLQWLPFSGAGLNDSIFLDVEDDAHNSFYAPDPCVPRLLPNTAASIVIPKNTLSTGAIADGTLMFSKASGFDTNTVPGMVGFAGYSKTTKFKLGSNGGTPATAPELQNLVRQPNGTVQFQVKAKPSAVLTVEGSSDLGAWNTITTAPTPASGVLEVTDGQAAGMSRRLYRAKTP